MPTGAGTISEMSALCMSGTSQALTNMSGSSSSSFLLSPLSVASIHPARIFAQRHPVARPFRTRTFVFLPVIFLARNGTISEHSNGLSSTFLHDSQRTPLLSLPADVDLFEDSTSAMVMMVCVGR
jgi:hypothetical protein